MKIAVWPIITLSAISNDEAIVAKIQKKLSRLICVSVKMSFKLGKPASLYSFPNNNNKSQKWGICPIKKKRATSIMAGSEIEPPAASQPM